MRTALVVGIIIGGLFYAGSFALPRRVSFSYAATSCQGELALLPGVNQAVDTAKFKLEYRGGLSFGKVKLASTQICFVPNSLPNQGVVRVAAAPFRGWLFRVNYEVAIGEAPRLLAAPSKPQPLSQPLGLKLSQPDTVFKYYLEADGKNQSCAVQSAQLLCGVNKLGLKQGTSYKLRLRRSFGGQNAGGATPIQLAILPATKVTAASIKPDEVIYTKPKSLEITLDKTLVSANAKLELLEGDKATPVNAQVKVEGSRIMLEWAEDLPRERTFRLALTGVAASDGSTLDGGYGFNFRTSGGPKVVGVSIGAAGVASNARVVVTFDQALSKDANLASVAGISGGVATISRRGGNQVVFALHDVPRCSVFTLSIAKGIVGEGGIASSQGWSQASRVSCGLIRTIGYSVKGRPIQAYFYGTGATTVLFTGGIHGDEPSGMYVMQNWASYLDVNGYQIPANKQIVVVPSLNPDGIASNSRYNANTVNIDRNFPSSDWVSDISIVGGRVLPRGGGAAPFSEPETRAIADLTSSLQLRAVFSFHSSGALVGANKVADSVAIGSQYAAAVGYGKMFNNPEAILGYSLTGEYETWIGEKFGAPAVLIELPTSSGRYFSRHQNVLWAMVNL